MRIPSPTWDRPSRDNNEIDEREYLAQKLFDYFDFNSPDGTYTYNLTRDKRAFGYGTMDLDDFQEIDEEFIYDLADFILQIFSKN